MFKSYFIPLTTQSWLTGPCFEDFGKDFSRHLRVLTGIFPALESPESKATDDTQSARHLESHSYSPVFQSPGFTLSALPKEMLCSSKTPTHNEYGATFSYQAPLT